MAVPPIPVLAALAASALAGALAGAAARLLLARLHRGTRVPPPWCEAATAVAWAITGTAAAAGGVPVPWLPVLLALGWLVVACAAVDLTRRRLPDALTLPALPAALLLLAPLGPSGVLRGAAGAAVAAGAHAAVHLAAPRALGAGDVKLAAPLGAVLAAASWPALAVGMLAGALLTGAVAAAGLACGLLPRGGLLPHGPSMLLAGWLVAGAAAAPG
jgi:leader peptidase (prepilin peptidase) / N-methyltransferase